jgi:DNA modification methylase
MSDHGAILRDLKVEQRPISSLRPYARNPRTHSPSQVDKLARAITEFGWTNPVLVDEAGGVLAGHGRLLAAERLGLTEVPVIRLEHLGEAQKRAYILADNQLALLAGWDEELLAFELGELQSLAFDLELTGFGTNELAAWLGAAARQGLVDDDEAPELPSHPVTRRDDVWLLGEHRLACGDATVQADVERALDHELADMTWTDPPYNVDYGNTAKDKQRGRGGRKILNDNLGSGFEAFLTQACTNLVGSTRGAIYIAMSSSELHTLQRAFSAAGGRWSTFVIWAKHAFTIGRADYQRSYEPILYGWPEGARRYWCGARDQGDVWHVDKPFRNDLHPTMKPVALVERAIRNSSRPGEVVLDPFAGSGSTLIAAARSGRRARLLELDPAYCDVICRRWQDWAGETAVRVGDDTRFDRVDPPLAEN